MLYEHTYLSGAKFLSRAQDPAPSPDPFPFLFHPKIPTTTSAAAYPHLPLCFCFCWVLPLHYSSLAAAIVPNPLRVRRVGGGVIPRPLAPVTVRQSEHSIQAQSAENAAICHRESTRAPVRVGTGQQESQFQRCAHTQTRIQTRPRGGFTYRLLALRSGSGKHSNIPSYAALPSGCLRVSQQTGADWMRVKSSSGRTYKYVSGNTWTARAAPGLGVCDLIVWIRPRLLERTGGLGLSYQSAATTASKELTIVAETSS